MLIRNKLQLTGNHDLAPRTYVLCHHFLTIENVFYFYAQEKYTKVVFDGGEALIEDSLKQLEMQYPRHLLRIHRNTLVNKNKILALHTLKNHQHVIELKGCSPFLAVSRRALKSVKSVL